MKKIILTSIFTVLFVTSSGICAENNNIETSASTTPATTEITVPATESVKHFSRPSDARFHYSLPDRKNFKTPMKRYSQTSNENDMDAIDLDTDSIKPAKKVIKVMNSNNQTTNINTDKSNLPMNYDNFPKFYDANDMSNQQILPMIGL